VDAAAALIDALSLDADDEPFQSSLIRNPHLERHWQVVEDLALGAQEPQPLETLDDQTRPNLEWIDSHTAVLVCVTTVQSLS
jgi:Ku70/Ku80 C-terminal arm